MLMILMIFGVYILSYIPTLFASMFDKCFENPGLRIFIYIINWSSVILNPIIYVAFQESYKDAIKSLFRFTDRQVVSTTFRRTVNQESKSFELTDNTMGALNWSLSTTSNL